jgi:toxin-antitoxin system PIN domain toxin
LTALLDINVLLALLDGAHVHHVRAKEWILSRPKPVWASCPLTQNGFVRIISQPSYPGNVSVLHAFTLLLEATSTEHHTFWPDDLSVLDESRFNASMIHGPRQITDAYLLALAVSHGGQLVALDRSISLSAVKGAEPHHLQLL